MRVLSYLRTRSTSTRHDERGFSLVEYSLLTAGIVVVVVTGVAVLAAAVLGLVDPLPF
jgi:Flp pilus assembly pilin Flp